MVDITGEIAAEFKQNLELEKRKTLTERVEEALDIIRPAVQGDGGDIVLDEINEERGLVFLKLVGSCHGCPSSQATLKNGVERIVKDRVPEIQEIIVVNTLGD